MTDVHELNVTLAPYLCSYDARKAIKFYVDALGGREDGPAWEEASGKIGHATVRFSATAVVYVSDAYPEAGAQPPKKSNLTDNSKREDASKLCLIVDDVDAVVDRCVAQGASVLMPVRDEKFLGRKSARICDPDGHVWLLSTNVRPVSDEELEESRKAFQKTGYPC